MRFRRVLPWAAAAILAGCGGGAGDTLEAAATLPAAPEAPAPTPPAAPPAEPSVAPASAPTVASLTVTLIPNTPTLVANPPVVAELARGESLGQRRLVARATGDVTLLLDPGRHARLDDPDGLFVGTPPRTVTDVPGGLAPVGIDLFVFLTGAPLQTPGRFQGELTVHVCLDAACTQRPTGSPLVLPYDVTVRP